MKKIFILAVAAVVLAGSTGCKFRIPMSSGNWLDSDLVAVTNSTRSADIPASLKYLAVDNPCGTIHVTGTETGTTRWTWKLTVHARTDAVAQEIARAMKCQAELDGGQLTILVSAPPSDEPHRIQSDFEITVPEPTAVRTQTHFGDTDIAGLKADVEAANQNGRIEIHDIGGKISARTSFESMTISDTGAATLHNQNGEITATRIGGLLQAETSFAPITAQDIAGPARLANQNGEIKAIGISGSLEAKTSFDSLVVRDIHGRASLANQNGQIEATGIAESLEAQTSFGSIEAHDVGGAARVRNQMGSVRLTQVKGNADIKTSFDRLSVEGIEGDALLVNQNGGIAANGVGGAVRANTSFGEMKINGAGADFVCHNQNGSIELEATSAAVTNIEATTSFDKLELRLPAELKPALLARTSFGDVESDFPVLAKPASVDVFAGMAPGTPRASLHNQNGDIRIRRD
jgi:hypothetical protein